MGALVAETDGMRRLLAGVLLLTLLVLAWPPPPPAGAALPEGFSDTAVFGGLTLPTSLAFAADGRVFVGEKSGIIKVFDGVGDTTAEPFADLSANVHDYDDRGFVGLAVNPNFPADPYVHVLYTHDATVGGAAPLWNDGCPSDGACTASGRLSRLRVEGNRMAAEEVLIEGWCTNYRAHSVGGLAFSPDGSALYASAGDGGGKLDYGQLGTPPNPCGDPPNEGGNLRAQDLRTAGDPVSLSGTVIRVDPKTGAPLPDNPLAASPGADENAKRIVAYGLRMPFRLAVRPGTSELWVGDVGRNNHDELNRVAPAQPNVVPNYGWPCYEGSGRHGEFEQLGKPICNGLYADAAAVTAPVLSYAHNQQLVPQEACPAPNAAAIAGLAFYQGSTYPQQYRGALFFGDYARSCLWMMRSGADGAPDPGTISTFSSDVGAIVDLQAGPGGDLFYVDMARGEVRRISYGTGGSTPPPAGGPAPTATISGPAAGTRWAVGDRIDFSGSATDAAGQSLPASALSWSIQLQHCDTPQSCHAHPLQTFQGVAGGSFTAPEHEYPSFLDVRLTATDPANGGSDTETLRLEPRTVELTFQSDPPGLQLDVDGVGAVTPFTRTAIVGSDVALLAPSPQQAHGASHEFVSWSQGGARQQTVVAPAEPATYRAVYSGGTGAGGGVARLAGPGRVETAASVSQATFAPGVPVAYVARADGFADALAGGPAAARQRGPVLLVSPGSVPAATTAELERLRPQRIVVLGGVDAVSDGVKAELQRHAPVERIAGNDRYATAADVSRLHFMPGVAVAYVATGQNFPDALAGGAAAAAAGGPLLLVRGDGVPEASAAELRRLRPQRIVVLGGATAVSAATEEALRSFGSVERRQGDDRYATAAAVSAAAFPAGVGTVYVATGRDFPDALSAVPAAGASASPLLLVDRDRVPAAVESELSRLAPRRIVVLGGPTAVTAEAQTGLAQHVTP
jgi:putative cell wall-binding protein/glucose/arabinose dehydrogenase